MEFVLEMLMFAVKFICWFGAFVFLFLFYSYIAWRIGKAVKSGKNNNRRKLNKGC